MQSLLNPRWLFVLSSAPVAILLFVQYGSYDIIESQLSKESITLWIRFGILLVALWVIHIAFALWQILKRQRLTWIYGVVALLLYIPLLYFYQMALDDLIPRNIPRWMLSEDTVWYAGSFIMPTLMHALIVIMVDLTHHAEKRKPWISFAIAVFIPVSWYLFLQFIFPLWQRVERSFFNEHVLIVFMITSVIIFLFFLMRGIYIISVKRSGFLQKYKLVWKILFVVCFPLAGLYVNNYEQWMIFGDFRNKWFFILAGLNGVTACLPALDQKNYRLILFLVRSITFTYILYFFLVFLPYLPFSIIAVIAIGLGFLMLTPLMALIIQSKMLSEDFSYLKKYHPGKTVIALFITGAIVLPLALTWSFLKDKQTLDNALKYVYEPDYSKTKENRINNTGLATVLDHVKENKDRRMGFNRQTPFISSYYNWLVLDNLTLSEQKITQLEKIFFGSPSQDSLPDLSFNTDKNISITHTIVSSVYDNKQQSWKSIVELEITNKNPFQAEYVTTFTLPTGTWINNYYLWINDQKVEGILAEKKAATWIYQQITSFRRDPGILYYLTGNRIAFRVFPFEAMQTRRTSLELLHKEPAIFHLDGHIISLGNEAQREIKKEITSQDGNFVYIPASIKNTLPLTNRKACYYFIMDCSAGKKDLSAMYDQLVRRFIADKNINPQHCKFILSNTYSILYDNLDNLPAALASTEFSGGFFVERSMEKILFRAVDEVSNTYPVMIVVTDSMNNAIVTKSLSDFSNSIPESDCFFALSTTGKLTPHSLVVNPKEPLQDTIGINDTYHVVAWPNAVHPQAYLRQNGEPSIILKQTLIQPTALPGQSTGWDAGLVLHGQWMSHILHPEKTDEMWLSLVRNSFAAHIMTPVTSFIVVENEAQRKVLLKKQEQVLSAKKFLDLGEETRMSEPDMWLLMLGACLVLLYRRKHLKKFLSPRQTN